ncbi:hypothetical protein EV192_104203 [Actinocrispum wychmicini]|uniref:Uncharacterized protein n=2 Tax=Actinocrispum wychmicini TaxID=1213861 RepID=A0A4R2JLA7_9PSEU|nr:hypothetical protein EV192_104203 [Actinocrispum wychmicini]
MYTDIDGQSKWINCGGLFNMLTQIRDRPYEVQYPKKTAWERNLELVYFDQCLQPF